MSADTIPGLAPCPFCGGAMRVQSNRDWHRLFGDHDDDCVWGQDDAVMMVPAQPDQLAAMVHAWNRRDAGPVTAWLINTGEHAGQEVTTLRERANLARHLGYTVTDLCAMPRIKP